MSEDPEVAEARAAAAMAHRDRRNPFADDPEGEPYLPEDGGHRLQRGWYGNDGTYVPSPTKRAPKPSAETRPRHRGSGAAGDDRRARLRSRGRRAPRYEDDEDVIYFLINFLSRTFCL